MITEKRNKYVYVIDYEDGRPCYIGVGTGHRMHVHVRDARSGSATTNARKNSFITDCLARGYTPVPYKIAEGLTISEANEYEKHLISWYGRVDLGTGCLLNACAGGFGTNDPGDITRAKMSEAAKARSSSPEDRAKQFSRFGGKKQSPDSYAAMSIKFRNRAFSQETRDKISAKALKRMASPEARANLSQKATAQWAAPDSLIKSPVTRAKMSLLASGKTASAETRAKMCASQRARRAKHVCITAEDGRGARRRPWDKKPKVVTLLKETA